MIFVFNFIQFKISKKVMRFAYHIYTIHINPHILEENFYKIIKDLHVNVKDVYLIQKKLWHLIVINVKMELKFQNILLL